MKPIYKPKGRAKEYGDYALNIYTGCNHGCVYCYAPAVLRKSKEEFAKVEPRKGIVEATRKQLASGDYKGKIIHLCFTCDPYPAEIDTTPTRDIIKAIKEAGAHVQILTKAGGRTEQDFDLLDSNDTFGITYSCFNEQAEIVEPNAPKPSDRLEMLIRAKTFIGCKTFVSCEPVYNTEDIYWLIRQIGHIDTYKIGKLNHMKSDINWAEFGKECERLCQKYNRNYYIKQDLRTEMEETR